MTLKLENIGRPSGYKKPGKRKGRGTGSGKGKTAGKGHKGALARSGGGTYNPGFEGGQMPLIRRIPKRGFTNIFKTKWNLINLGVLESSPLVESGAVIDKGFLLRNRMLKKKELPLKVLAKGKLSKTLIVKADKFAVSAREAIEAAGGKAEIVAGVKL
ncbi:MAG: 50S ribosomal protein L15 [Candidatus Omnitrophica bacterium]|nr:50S ribosomal protein L15 [Candidatus Omnitrophota bacterium]